MADILTRGDIVTFTVYPATILGTKYTSVKVLSILDYETAKSFVDIDALHRNVYPTLPGGTVPNDPSQYDYVKVRFGNGSSDIIGLPWINAATIVVSSSQTLQLTFANISPIDQNRLKQVIAANGFVIESTVVS